MLTNFSVQRFGNSFVVSVVSYFCWMLTASSCILINSCCEKWPVVRCFTLCSIFSGMQIENLLYCPIFVCIVLKYFQLLTGPLLSITLSSEVANKVNNSVTFKQHLSSDNRALKWYLVMFYGAPFTLKLSLSACLSL